MARPNFKQGSAAGHHGCSSSTSALPVSRLRAHRSPLACCSAHLPGAHFSACSPCCPALTSVWTFIGSTVLDLMLSALTCSQPYGHTHGREPWASCSYPAARWPHGPLSVHSHSLPSQPSGRARNRLKVKKKKKKKRLHICLCFPCLIPSVSVFFPNDPFISSRLSR